MIHINDRYAIEADERQYTLIEKKIVQDGERAGKDYNVPLGYYPTVRMLLSDLIQRRQREFYHDNTLMLKDAVIAFERIAEETKGWLAGAIKEGERQ